MKEEVKVMEDKRILKDALKRRQMTQKKLSEEIGMKPSALSMNMTRDRMGLDMFKKILNGLGYDVGVIDRRNDKVVWIVEPEDEWEDDI